MSAIADTAGFPRVTSSKSSGFELANKIRESPSLSLKAFVAMTLKDSLDWVIRGYVRRCGDVLHDLAEAFVKHGPETFKVVVRLGPS